MPRMLRASRVDFPDALYHVISRGTSREDIFWNDDDRRHFRRECRDAAFADL
jgi:hypothetical protein